MEPIMTAVLHYSAPPVVGGVESVIGSHARVFNEAGYMLTVIAGRGDGEALPPGTGFILIPGMDTQHPEVLEMAAELENGRVPPGFQPMADRLAATLEPVLHRFDHVIVHNIFSKHFNLPLTAALAQLLDSGVIRRCIAWCHDSSWTSPNSRSKVHEGYPWDLLRTYRPGVNYVAVSQQRQHELAGLMGVSPGQVRVVYNGVDARVQLGLSEKAFDLVQRLNLFESDLVLLMPVRLTRAKNVEFALQVIAGLKERKRRVKVVLTGPPDPHAEDSLNYWGELQELRKALGVEEEMRFVYESGPDASQAYTIDNHVVGELYRVCDAVFIPSLREGFGMPVLEAGLAGIPVVCTEIPAAKEIGDSDVLLFSPASDPDGVAAKLLAWVESSPVYRMRRRVRQNYTWDSIFKHQIEPLLRSTVIRMDDVIR
ncbi:MAG: glycosyltransferase [Chloroflexota bacterium]|nr:MAG: glycosyltransferase [Chloroflexota bacterium]